MNSAQHQFRTRRISKLGRRASLVYLAIVVMLGGAIAVFGQQPQLDRICQDGKFCNTPESCPSHDGFCDTCTASVKIQFCRDQLGSLCTDTGVIWGPDGGCGYWVDGICDDFSTCVSSVTSDECGRISCY